MAPASPSPPATVSQQSSILSKLAQPFARVHCFPYTNIVNYSRGAAALRVYLPSITAPHQHRANRLEWKATWREINRKLMKDQSDAPGKSLLKTHAAFQRVHYHHPFTRGETSAPPMSHYSSRWTALLYLRAIHTLQRAFFLPTDIGQK